MDTIFIDDFSKEVWETTYKHSSDATIDDTMHRVATAIASVEDIDNQQYWADKFYDMLSGFKVTPGGRIYSNAGTEFNGASLINCFLSPETTHSPDSIKGIYEKLLDQALTLKSEGGWGTNFSALRPRGAYIKGVGVDSPGAIAFMELFDKSSDIVTRGSGMNASTNKAKKKIRKGAMMAVLDCWHPDIIEFIQAKQTPNRLNKFNISVNCTDEFMKLVNDINDSEDNDPDWNLIFPDTTHPSYNSVWKGDITDWEKRGYPVNTHHTVKVRWLWNLIMESTFTRADPGVLFLDRANEYYAYNYGNTLVATNPCGEQVLPPSGSCDLASINLTQFVTNGKFDIEKFTKYIPIVVRFLDNVNSYTNLPLPEYEVYVSEKRRIGVGVLGWASMLYMVKIRFGSAEAAALREDIMKTLSHVATSYSVDLAEEKGMFAGCIPEKHIATKYMTSLHLDKAVIDKMQKVGIRNSALLSCQPTGNTSIFANVVSGGIEPIFAQEYTRTVIVNVIPKHIKEYTPNFHQGEFFETSMFKFVNEGSDKILRGVDTNGTVFKIDKNRGLTKEVDCIDYGVRYLIDRGEWDKDAEWAVTAQSLTPTDHINDLYGFAKYIDSSVSKTINCPYDYPYEDFKHIYLDAYNKRVIKGITTYRSGTMAAVLSTKPESSEEEIILDTVKLPVSSPATMKILKAEGRKWYLTVLHTDDNRPHALFVHTNAIEKTIQTSDAIDALTALARKKGIPENFVAATLEKAKSDSNSSKVARVISLNLRHGVLIKNIVFELDKLDMFVGSFLFQVKKFLSSYVKDGERIEGATCETCGGTNIVFSEGCSKCMTCGSSKCG